MAVYVNKGNEAINVEQLQHIWVEHYNFYVSNNYIHEFNMRYGVDRYKEENKTNPIYINGGIIKFNRNYKKESPHFNEFELACFTTYEKAIEFYNLLLDCIKSNKNHVLDINKYSGLEVNL
jgi:hypothetical protein